jgi:Membrane domain of glycerophosphoryl diester phosphodiesterase
MSLSAPSFTPQLRPLSVGEMLDAGFRLFRHRFMTLVACVLVPVVPLTILGTIILASTDPDAFDVNATSTDSGAALAGFLISLFLQSAGAALAVAACFKAISAAYLGERTSFGDSLSYALRRFIPLMIAYIVIVIITIPGWILLIIPGIWLSVKMCMAFPAVIFERAGPFRSIGRSWKLTADNWWRVFGTLVVVFLIALVVNFALGAVLGIVAATSDTLSELAFAILNTVVTLLTYMLTYPLWAAVMTVIYYDLRVRNEGFDLQLLAQGVGADASRFESSPERPIAPPPDQGAGGFRPPETPATSS